MKVKTRRDAERLLAANVFLTVQMTDLCARGENELKFESPEARKRFVMALAHIAGMLCFEIDMPLSAQYPELEAPEPLKDSEGATCTI